MRQTAFKKSAMPDPLLDSVRDILEVSAASDRAHIVAPRCTHMSSPPATTILCPVIDAEDGKQSQPTVSAISSGRTSRP